MQLVSPNAVPERKNRFYEGRERYPQIISDAGGLVPAGKTQTAFFVVTGTATGGRNDLAVTNKFDIVMRQVTGERDPHRKASAEWQEPPDAIPSAQSGWQEPALPIAESGSTPSQLRAVSDEKPRTSQKHRGKPSSAPGANRSTRLGFFKGHRYKTGMARSGHDTVEGHGLPEVPGQG